MASLAPTAAHAANLVSLLSGNKEDPAIRQTKAIADEGWRIDLPLHFLFSMATGRPDHGLRAEQLAFVGKDFSTKLQRGKSKELLALIDSAPGVDQWLKERPVLVISHEVLSRYIRQPETFRPKFEMGQYLMLLFPGDFSVVTYFEFWLVHLLRRGEI